MIRSANFHSTDAKNSILTSGSMTLLNSNSVLTMGHPQFGKYICLLMTVSSGMLAQVAVTTQHNDLSRTGVNPSETILTTSNVNVNTFGKLFSRTVDGQIYSQPLYLPNVAVPGQGVHNIVYVCTEHNSVYAFDADDPAAATPLWHVNLGATRPPVTGSIQPETGIISTPVIDQSSNTLFVVAPLGASNYQFHALDITSGAERPNSPVTVQGSVSGTSIDSSNGTLTFNAALHWQRPGLLLLNGNVYVAFASHGDDTEPYHGWIFAYSASTLLRTSILCLSPNGLAAGVWGGGLGLAADPAGHIYVQTGNGTMDANTGGSDHGDSMLKLGAANGLTVLDYFSPSNENTLDIDDADLGSSGPILIPGTSLAVGGGKDGRIFLVNTNSMGQFHSPDQMVQEWQATFNEINGSGGIFGSDVAYYNSKLYLWGRHDVLKAFAFNGTTFNTTPVSQTATAIPDGYSNEPALSISANGVAPGSGIVWAAYSTTGQADGFAYPGILHAFDASDLTHELWNSNQNSSRDYSGAWAKWCPPTIANGKVYLGTFDSELNVFGLLPAQGSGGSLSGSSSSSAATANLTAEGAADWVHWGDSSLNRKTGVTAQISTYTQVGSGGVISYNNDPRPLSWTDGAPTTTGASNTNGLFISASGNGFRFTAPADTSTRTLTVHLGGWNSAGTLNAHLSDGSAPDFTDTTANTSGQYDRNYTLTYHASSPQQRLTVSWVMSSGAGNVTLSGAAVMIEAINYSLAVAGGTPQSTTVNTAFTKPFQAALKDANSLPIGGATVTFTAPGSGASGSFGGSGTASAVTDSNGIATAPAFTANGQPGTYVVTATTSGATTPVSFSLTNVAPISGALSGSGTNSNTAASLTAEGTSDWVHWGEAVLNRKNGVTAQISTYMIVGNGGASTYGNDPRPLAWADGAPTPTGSNNTDGLFIRGTGNGFQFTVPADTSARTLIVHVGGWNSGGTLTAHLSDGSAADFVDTTLNTAGQWDRNYTLVYNASAGQNKLTVTWAMTSGTGNVTLSGAALSLPTGSIAGSGDSSTTAANLTVEGASDWVHWGDATLNRKAGVAQQISTYSRFGSGNVSTYSPDLRLLNWTDGTPTASSTNNSAGLFISGVGNGFSLTAPADTTNRTLIVHVGGWNSGGTLTATLSDGSAANFVDTTANAAGQWDRNYTLTYRAGSAQQSLTVTWIMSSGTGNVTVGGAALH
jgi:hypothetical protein